MKQPTEEKYIQITASLKESLRNDVVAIAEAEDRSFSQTTAILLSEAVEARNKSKNKK